MNLSMMLLLRGKSLTFTFFVDFKSHHVISEEVEIVDLYQIVCFLLDIPTSDNHEGSWNRVKDMLTISGE